MGTCTVEVSADADLGQGVKTIAGSLDIEVSNSEAATVVITAGAPEVQ